MTITPILFLKKKLCCFIIVSWLISSLFPLVNSDPGWLGGFNYRRRIDITGSVGAGVNYQVLINVTWLEGMDNQFDYLRFTADDGVTLIPAYRQSYVNKQYALIWVKVSSNLDTDQYIRMYWGTGVGFSYYNATEVFIGTVPNVVASWLLDETDGTDTVIDYSGNGYDGTPTSTTIENSYFSGQKARRFDGTNSYVSIPAINQRPVVMESRIKCYSYPGSSVALIVGTSVTDTLAINSGASAGKVWSGATINYQVLTETWTHLILVSNDTYDDLYVNGVYHSSVANGYYNLGNGIGGLAGGQKIDATLSTINLYSSITTTQINQLANGYPDPKINPGNIYVRKWVYPEPYVSNWGTISEGEPTAQQAYEYAEELFGVSVVFILIFFVVAIGVTVALKRR